jgi:3-oxoacyl-[acyl-carrier protein] reductase
VLDLNGRVALITGASRGIGRAIALALGRRGATIIAADIRADGVSTLAQDIVAAGGRAESAVLDITDGAAVEEQVASVLARHSRLDILVNNAGIARDQLLMRMKREEWDAVLTTNLTGAFLCSQAVVRPMMKQRSGRIINISSVVGMMGNAGQTNYAASKAGLVGFTKALAREVASRGITVNAVAPGLIDTDMTRALTDSVRSEWVSKVPLGRFGTAEDVASAVCFLASDEASYITGQVLGVNGGMYM